jgi:hypothetical protein
METREQLANKAIVIGSCAVDCGEELSGETHRSMTIPWKKEPDQCAVALRRFVGGFVVSRLRRNLDT